MSDNYELVDRFCSIDDATGPIVFTPEEMAAQRPYRMTDELMGQYAERTAQLRAQHDEAGELVTRGEAAFPRLVQIFDYGVMSSDVSLFFPLLTFEFGADVAFFRSCTRSSP